MVICREAEWVASVKAARPYPTLHLHIPFLLRRFLHSANHYNSLSPPILVGNGEIDLRLVSARGDLFQALQRAARQSHGRLACGKIDEAHVRPENAMLKSGSQSLRASFLGGKALRIRGRALGSPFGFNLLHIGKNAVDEFLPVTLEHLFHAPDVDEIAAQTNNHVATLASSIKWRMRLIAGPKPLKTASPIRK